MASVSPQPLPRLLARNRRRHAGQPLSVNPFPAARSLQARRQGQEEAPGGMPCAGTEPADELGADPTGGNARATSAAGGGHRPGLVEADEGREVAWAHVHLFEEVASCRKFHLLPAHQLHAAAHAHGDWDGPGAGWGGCVQWRRGVAEIPCR